MSDEFGAPLVPVTPPVADPVSSAPVVGSTAIPTADPAIGEGTNQPAEPKRYTQEEVDRVAQKERERAERRADKRYQQILETALGRQTQQQPKPVATDALPKRESFSSDEDFAMAVIEHKAEQKAKEYVDKRSREDSEVRARQEQQKVAESYQERVTKVAAKYDDFSEVVENPQLTISPAMAAVIQLHDQGPEVAYHLGKNPEEARRIASLHPLRAAAEIGALAAKLAATPTPGKPTSNAPAPIAPVAGKTVVEKDPDDMTTAEFRRWRKHQIAQRR